MQKIILTISLILLIAGCTDNFNSSEINQHNTNQENYLLTENYTTVDTASDMPGLESINPLPGDNNLSVTGIITMVFIEDAGYGNYYVGLYEKTSMNTASFDTTTYDSFSSNDLGIKVMSALKPDTEYVLRLESITNSTVYYIKYTTGVADTIKPIVEQVATSGTQLEIFFSERIDTSTINSENVIVSGKTGDFDNIMVSGYYLEQEAYVDFNLSYYEDYSVTIKGIKDLAGNIMDEQILNINARTI